MPAVRSGSCIIVAYRPLNATVIADAARVHESRALLARLVDDDALQRIDIAFPALGRQRAERMGRGPSKARRSRRLGSPLRNSRMG